MPASNLCWSRKGSGRLTWSSASAGSCTGSLTPATKWKQHRGWEATRMLKGDPQTRDIPVIALSAHALAGEREKALAAGCNEFDTKPIEFDRLVATLRRILADRK